MRVGSLIDKFVGKNGKRGKACFDSFFLRFLLDDGMIQIGTYRDIALFYAFADALSRSAYFVCA